ncbi:hypothetical protein GCL60_00965 [Silvanigrella paludirubra]|uniref:Methyltransferase n=1 Tax=Silvanigrella paludirubra TaxID=2499159 RepID=A0A6N6VXQ1_9BACT|nr:hypothetical protein [Silvanigrella paludirubra]KAB8040517.1 hypothetical protein GCL60_00965 [Silvanigrella paludirubra]
MPRPVIDHSETNEYFTIKVTKPSLRYIDFFLKLKSAAKLIDTGFYPNAKEISETQGAFEAVRHKLKLDYNDESIAILVVGDGYNPRTGYYIANMTKWTIFSIDPAMERDYNKILEKINDKKNINIIAKKIEDCSLNLNSFQKIVLLFVHSHASLKETINSIQINPNSELHAVSMPCCFDDDLGIPYDITYDDPYVISVHRSLFIYKNIMRHFVN